MKREEKIEIYESIINFERNSRLYGRDNETLFKDLIENILRLPNERKKKYLQFFLDEIKTNEYNMWKMAVDTLLRINMDETEWLGKELTNIYKEVSIFKDEEWKQIVMGLLMNMYYSVPKDLYWNYVKEQMKKNQDTYFLLLDYCKVDTFRAMALLSDYFVENISKKTMTLTNMGFLMKVLEKHPTENLLELLSGVSKKNQKAYLHLKEIIINYLRSDTALIFKHNKNAIILWEKILSN
jgi:hypothetical protein